MAAGSSWETGPHSWQCLGFLDLWRTIFLLQPAILEMLVANGADLEAKTKNGETPFGEFLFLFAL